jgi:hypothetical protein
MIRLDFETSLEGNRKGISDAYRIGQQGGGFALGWLVL